MTPQAEKLIKKTYSLGFLTISAIIAAFTSMVFPVLFLIVSSICGSDMFWPYLILIFLFSGISLIIFTYGLCYITFAPMSSKWIETIYPFMPKENRNPQSNPTLTMFAGSRLASTINALGALPKIAKAYNIKLPSKILLILSLILGSLGITLIGSIIALIIDIFI